MKISGDRLRKAREAAGLSQADLARAMKCERSRVSVWERDRAGITPDYAQRAADATGVPVAFLQGETELMGVRREPARASLPEGALTLTPSKPMRLYGSVPAGSPWELSQAPPETTDCCGLNPATHFAVRVQGDSMSPDYVSGDIVFLKEVRYEMGPKCDGPTPIQNWTALEGEDVVCFRNDQCTLKRFTIHRANGDYQIVLKPLNPVHKDIEIGPGDSLLVQGIVVMCLHRKRGH